MSEAIRISFEQKVLDLPVESLLPLRPMTARITGSRKYARIATSIKKIGVIEPLAVTKADSSGRHLLLDGHLRLHAIMEEGKATAPCIIADDDEAFTYNKRVNRLATVQEHYMIQRALDRGVPASMIAAALGIDAKLVQRRSKLLDGIAPEAVDTAEEGKGRDARTDGADGTGARIPKQGLPGSRSHIRRRCPPSRPGIALCRTPHRERCDIGLCPRQAS